MKSVTSNVLPLRPRLREPTHLEFDRDDIVIGSRLMYSGAHGERGPWVVHHINSVEGKRQRKVRDGHDRITMVCGGERRTAGVDYMRYSIRWHLIPERSTAPHA